jgi:hypothetical protein
MNTNSMLSVYSRGIRRNDSSFNSSYQAQEIYRKQRDRDARIREEYERRQRQQEMAREAAERREMQLSLRKEERVRQDDRLSPLDNRRARAWIEEWKRSSLNRFAHRLNTSSVLALLS